MDLNSNINLHYNNMETKFQSLNIYDVIDNDITYV